LLQCLRSRYHKPHCRCPILHEKNVTASSRQRSSAESYCCCVRLDKNELLTLVWTVLKSYRNHVFTRCPLRRMVNGSTYTVIPASSLPPTATHSAYTGPLLSTRSVISDAKPNSSSVAA